MCAQKAPADISPELRAARSRGGRLGSASRWGPPRVARLDDLDPRIRDAVLALIRADQAAKKGIVVVSDDALEVSRDAFDTTTAGKS